MKSTRQFVSQEFIVENEVWCRFGLPATVDAASRYSWIKDGEFIQGYFEEVKKISSGDDEAYIVKLISEDYSTRYIAFIPERVLKFIDVAINNVKAVKGVEKAFLMRLHYHGKKTVKRDKKVITYHDIEVLYDDEKVSDELIKHYEVVNNGNEKQ